MEEFFIDLSLILVVSAALSSLAVILKQPIILAYIICGVAIGPWGLGWVKNVEFLEGISHLGITLLLFLAGLCLHPQKLIGLFKKDSLATGINSVISFIFGFVVSTAFGFSQIDSLCIALAMMFSSTILVIKLLPTNDLHHKRMGAVCIGILILQDLLAVAVLAFIRCLGSPDGAIQSFTIISLKLVFFIAALIAIEYYVLRRIMSRVDKLHEALFVLGLAWCFGVATISNHIGLFYETGAFFSGVVLARHRISYFIFEKLTPLRDFFLVLFFFTLGSRLEVEAIKNLYLITLVLGSFILVGRPWIFQRSLVLSGEKPKFSTEVGIRLGQMSEFGLLVAFLALDEGHITNEAAQLIQLVTILTFMISSYVVFRRYPTPIAS